MQPLSTIACRIGDQFDYEADGKQYLLEIKGKDLFEFHQHLACRQMIPKTLRRV
jgi:hypothetical protein